MKDGFSDGDFRPSLENAYAVVDEWRVDIETPASSIIIPTDSESFWPQSWIQRRQKLQWLLDRFGGFETNQPAWL